VQEEKNAAQLLDEEERPQFVPTAYDSLRRVSAAVSPFGPASVCNVVPMFSDSFLARAGP